MAFHFDRTLLCDPTLIHMRDQWLEVLEQMYGGVSSALLQKNAMVIGGREICSQIDPLTEPERWVEDSLALLCEVIRENREPEVFSPYCINCFDFHHLGTHFVDAILGAEIFVVDGEVNSRYLSTPVGSLAMPDYKNHPATKAALKAAQHFRSLKLGLPMFCLPTLSSVLNVAVNLYGGDVLAELLDDDEAVVHDLNIIHEVILGLHGVFRDCFGDELYQCVMGWDRTQPVGFGQLCGCTSQLVSGDMYRKYFAAYDDALLALYPHGGMIHLCGTHTQHIEVFQSMKHLRSVQLNDNAARDLPHYAAGLRPDQLIYISLCDGVTAEWALEQVSSNRLVIQRHFSPVKV